MVLTATLERNGVKVFVEEETDRFEGEGKVSAVISKTGNKYEAQVVGIGIGIRPDIDWLRDSGLEIGRGIITNEYLETKLPDVYAAGDCAEFYDVIFERRHVLGNWANAVSQGNSVARTMLGQKTVFETASSYTSNFFDGSCSFVGVTDAMFADEIISRGSVESGRMTRIFIKSIRGVMRIVGATVINSAIDVAPLTVLIKGKADISGNREKLSDIGFNLVELVKF
jgi:NAD(P)H-nitrite reductase large subunit